MRIINSVCLVIAICMAKKSELGLDDDIIKPLTTHEFRDFLNTHKHVAVYFYEDNCKKCKEFVPNLHNIAKKLKGHEINFVSVNLSTERMLERKVKTNTRPAVKFYIFGVHVLYDGPFTEDSLYHFIVMRSSNHTQEIIDASELEHFIAQSRSVVYFLPEDDEESLEIFEALAPAYIHIPFRYSHDQKLKAPYGDATHVLTFFRDYNEGHKSISFEEKLTPDLVKSFMESHKAHYVADMVDEINLHYFSTESAAMVYLSNSFDEPEFTVYESVAKIKWHSFFFFKGNLKHDLVKNFTEYLSIDRSKTPIICIIYAHKNEYKYIKVDDLTQEGLKKAIQNFKHQELVTFVKSQDPIDNTDRLVKIIVTDNFHELVIDNDKVVLLNVYLPWCEICKNFQQTYDDLAKLLKDESDIVIAKIDGTLNDHKYIDVDTHPTLLLYIPKAKDKPQRYVGVQSINFIVEELEKVVGRELPREIIPISEEL